MSIVLDTNSSNPEIEHAAMRPLFNAADYDVRTEREPISLAIEAAREQIGVTVLNLIDKCEALEGEICDDPEAEHDRRMRLYDAKAAVRSCAEKAVSVLQRELPVYPYKIGSTMYMVITDPHAKIGNGRQLIMLDDTDNISFMEPRGLQGDDLATAKYEHHVRLIEDIIAASQRSA